VKLCYALRRGVFYPSTRDEFGQMPPRSERHRYLPLVKSMGFDAVEVGVDDMVDEQGARDLARELTDQGLAIGCVRAGGGLSSPFAAAEASARLERAVRLAGVAGASVVNTALVNPLTHPGGPGAGHQGERVSQGASRVASERDYAATAERLRSAGRLAADAGVKISIEVHQGSIADNSRATLHLLDLVGLDSVGANPDLGNIYWQYEYPEESPEAAIIALAPRAVYWHCKNLLRTHIPDLQRSFFARVPLPDGEIDYRFAISAMLAAGYEGYFAVEGAQKGDQLTQDRRSLEYARGLLAELAAAPANGRVAATV
jgi:sugar phosphate isomerase/epimerase